MATRRPLVMAGGGIRELPASDSMLGAADDPNAVKLTGDQTVNGIKAFSKRSSHAGAFTPSVQMAYSGSIGIDCAQGNVFEPAPLTGAATTLKLINPGAGQTIQIRLQQDATGGRGVSTSPAAKIDGTPNTGANRVNWLVLTYSARASRWEGNWVVVPA